MVSTVSVSVVLGIVKVGHGTGIPAGTRGYTRQNTRGYGLSVHGYYFPTDTSRVRIWALLKCQYPRISVDIPVLALQTVYSVYNLCYIILFGTLN